MRNFIEKPLRKNYTVYKLNNATLNYSDHADIQISLLLNNGIHLGKPKLFSSHLLQFEITLPHSLFINFN